MLILASLMKLPELKKQIKTLQRVVDSMQDDTAAIAEQEAA